MLSSFLLTMWKEKHQSSKCILKNIFPGKCDLCLIEQIMSNLSKRYTFKYHSKGTTISAGLLLSCSSHSTWDWFWGLSSAWSESRGSQTAKVQHVPDLRQHSVVKWQFKWQQLIILPSETFCFSRIFRVWSLSIPAQD